MGTAGTSSADAGIGALASTMYSRMGDEWDKSKSELVAFWCDIAQSYGWMHADASRLYHWRAGCLNVPVIIISTFTGAATATLGSLFAGPEYTGISPFIAIGLGMLSLVAGVLGTLEQKFKFAQLAERHQRSSTDCYQLWRMLDACLALHHSERPHFRFFLENMQTTINALMESRPSLPGTSVRRFRGAFGHVVGLRRPHECGQMVPTSPEPIVARATQLPLQRLRRMAEATQLALTRGARERLQRATSRAVSAAQVQGQGQEQEQEQGQGGWIGRGLEHIQERLRPAPHSVDAEGGEESPTIAGAVSIVGDVDAREV